MARSDEKVILYRYNGSPFANKIESVLAMRGIPHFEVDVPMTLPRPEVIDLLGIGYRRIPLLAIGNDVYCDTSLIVSQLEKRIPPSAEYVSVFPPRKNGGKVDRGIIKTFAMTYGDRTLFPMGGAILPYDKLGKKFMEDRSAWQGAPIPVEALTARRPITESQLSSHMAILEEQLSDEREWLFDTDEPGYGDLSVHFFWSWVIQFRGMKEVLSSSKFPKTNSWITRMSTYLAERRKANSSSVSKISAEEAAKFISQGSPSNDKLHFDKDEAARLHVNLGDIVSIVPEDNAKNYPTVGKLIGLDREEFVVELSGKAVSSLRCHLPRLNFAVRVSKSASKL
ncbi:hypothetical protein SCHPADRAFT_867167 [Schizopora paradoxa]|uniref:Uncharacterized protein n=1 Tax=Schizopora paradoxa TaxID=27342 RepID=A0A0H2S228_9AGAM|nr:hypothetical protein SCHPADRAFT_867167 [Schizopora paradoxa]